jgi:hypothetical protein
MENHYQPEEVIFSANYQTFKDYFTSTHLATPRGGNNVKLPGIIIEEGGESVLDLSTNQSAVHVSENSFFLSWHIVHLAYQQPRCVWVRSPSFFHYFFKQF